MIKPVFFLPKVFAIISDTLKFVKKLKAKGVYRYETSLIKEYDMGEYYLQISSYNVFSKDNQALDTGT